MSPTEASRPKLAFYWGASCGGCDIAVLEIHEHLLQVIDAADIVFWPTVIDFKLADVEAMADRSIDLCLFNGGIRTEENAEVARLLRRKSKLLLAYGACASIGGIPGLLNLYSTGEMLERVYGSSESTLNAAGTRPQALTQVGEGKEIPLTALRPRLQRLDDLVTVDYSVPGCPPVAEQTWAVLEAALAGNLPPVGSVLGAGDKSVCDECQFEKRERKIKRFYRPHEVIASGEVCLLEEGIICAGPATRSGCGAQCPSVNMPCRGCYGPPPDTLDVGAKMVSALGGLIDSEDPAEIARMVGEVADPAGTFYRFALPSSLLDRGKG